MNEKDVAVVGIGYWGKNLARNYYELGVLSTICEADFERIKEFQFKFPEVSFTSNFDDILEDESIKKVIISVPTKLHYSLAKRALEAKKDVFIEKAMCNSLEEAQDLANYAEDNGLILMVGHLLNYHPAVITIKELIDQKELGDIYHLSFSRLNFGSVGEENSALWAFAPHDISVLLSLTKEKKLCSLSSRNKQFFSSKFIDQSWIHFEFEDGISADIQVGWAFPYSDRKFTVMGTKGMIVFDDLREWHEKVMLWRNQVKTDNQKISFHPALAEKIEIDQKEPLKEECRHFLTCCKNRERPLTDGQEALKVMEVLEKVRSSENALVSSEL